jgi:alkylated DNA repair dioxygenase AlkB
MYGKPYLQSRSIASYVTSPELTAKYSGHSVKMNCPYPPLLREIQDVVSRALGVGFDYVMLNWYQDGSVHIGKHRDTKENQVSYHHVAIEE